MTVTTTYSLDFVRELDLTLTSTDMDLTGLADGGLAGAGTGLGVVNTSYYDDNGDATGANTAFGVQQASLDQIGNGNVVIAGQTAGGLAFRITGPSGDVVASQIDIADSTSSEADVAALAGGGFVIASQDNFSATDNDIDLRFFDSAGAAGALVTVDNTVANDTGASVAGLNDGGVAVAWTRTLNDASTEIWTAVYEASGAVRSAPTLLDTQGTVNAGASVVALATGGFAVAYADSGIDGTADIVLARFAAAGNSLGLSLVTTGSDADSAPSLTMLSNGMLAVSFSQEDEPGDHDVFVQLIDAVTGSTLLSGPSFIDLTNGDSFESSSAAWGLVGLATTVANGSRDGQFSRVMRLSNGDGAADSVTGDDAVDRMDGAGGADTLSGMGNGDTLFGGTGTDSLLGGTGEDTLWGEDGADSLFGGDGDDLLRPAVGDDALDGGAGIDTGDYSGIVAATVDLGHVGQQNTGGGGLDRLVGIENLDGSNQADTFSGDGLANRLTGNAGNDTLTGTGGADTLDGGQGADRLDAGAADDLVMGHVGADVMSGGSGVDTLDYTILNGEIFLDLSISAAQNTHAANSDAVIGFENVVTGAGADRIRGNGSANQISTGEGGDTGKAGGGDDTIRGGGGDDVISGGGGADLIWGGAGGDEMRGGVLDDTFAFAALADGAVGLAVCDVIRDFRTSDGDRIDLSGLDAGELSYIGSSAFGGVGAHEVRVTSIGQGQGQGQLVEVDADGDGASDMDILVRNSGLAGGAADFVL